MMANTPAMETVPNCPACDGDLVRELTIAGDQCRVFYYRCHCSHVWCVDKDNPELIHHVTPLRDKLHTPAADL